MDIPPHAMARSNSKALEAVVEAMENADFPVAFRGYEPRDVRTFLIRLADEIRRWLAHQQTMFLDLSARIAELETELESSAATISAQRDAAEVAAAEGAAADLDLEVADQRRSQLKEELESTRLIMEGMVSEEFEVLLSAARATVAQELDQLRAKGLQSLHSELEERSRLEHENFSLDDQPAVEGPTLSSEGRPSGAPTWSTYQPVIESVEDVDDQAESQEQGRWDHQSFEFGGGQVPHKEAQDD